MRIPPMKLTYKKCETSKYNANGKGNKLFDGGGLFLHIKETGKFWRLKYRFNNKEKLLSLGPFPLLGLAEAREMRDQAKKLLLKNQDPGEIKKRQKLELQKDYENNFENIALEWHEQRIHTWKPDYAEVIKGRFKTYLLPHIGKRPLKDITAPELLATLKKIEKDGKRDLAHRMLQMCSQIFRYAVATGRGERDIAVDLKGALQPVKSKNYAHLSEKQFPEFLNKLEKYDSEYKGSILTKLAFKLLILTFVRSGEIRGAKWEEIDFDKAIWRIPEERMKMSSPHIVPLAKQSIEILNQIKQISGGNNWGYIFPSMKQPNRIMSENTFLRAIEVLGYKTITTAHGFRSTASTILNENGFKSDVIERQLAHCERDQVRAAYNYAEYLSDRKEMMQWWADHIDSLVKK